MTPRYPTEARSLAHLICAMQRRIRRHPMPADELAAFQRDLARYIERRREITERARREHPLRR